MDVINDFLRKNLSYHIYDSCKVQEIRPRMKCADGYSVSIQASRYHYCKPRIDGEVIYESVELGFPSAEDPLINDYAEDSYDFTGTVYGYVPIDIVIKLVEKHGGII